MDRHVKEPYEISMALGARPKVHFLLQSACTSMCRPIYNWNIVECDTLFSQFCMPCSMIRSKEIIDEDFMYASLWFRELREYKNPSTKKCFTEIISTIKKYILHIITYLISCLKPLYCSPTPYRQIECNILQNLYNTTNLNKLTNDVNIELQVSH